jgi:membrane-associated phospholipid phosphatase
LQRFLKDNLGLLLAYLLLFATAMFYVLSYEKADIHLYLNQYVGNRYLNAFFYFITYLGDGRLAPLILLAIVITNVRLGITTSACFITAAMISNGLKYFFFDDVDRPFFIFQYFDKRPITMVEGVDLHIHNSFPSGHATQAFAILVCLAFAARPAWLKLSLLGIALFTSLSRVYLSQHWLADVTVGSFIGFLCASVWYYYIVYRDRLPRFDKPITYLMQR